MGRHDGGWRRLWNKLWADVRTWEAEKPGTGRSGTRSAEAGSRCWESRGRRHPFHRTEAEYSRWADPATRSHLTSFEIDSTGWPQRLAPLTPHRSPAAGRGKNSGRLAYRNADRAFRIAKKRTKSE